MIKDFFYLALGNIRHKGIRSWLTILGIFIGILAVVALISLGNGLKDAVGAQFGISSTEIISVEAGGVTFGPPGSGVVTPLTLNDLNAVKRVNNVEQAVRRNLPTGKVTFNNRAVFGMATSIPDKEERKFVYEQLDLEVMDGRLLKDGDTNKVVVGYNFYTDSVGLEKEVKVGNKIELQNTTFEVIGIAEKTGSFIFDNTIYVNDKPLEQVMGYGDDIDMIAVQVKDNNLMEKTKEDIEKAMRQSRDVKEGEEDFKVSTPEAALATVNQVIGGVQVFIVLIAAISIFVGALGIVNTMTTSVLERKKEIGIMKAVGATNGQIFLQFFIESGLMGLIGGILGVICGLLVGYAGISGLNSFIGGDIKLNIDIALIISVLTGSFLIGSLSGIAPAMQAANQNPVEALRG